MAYFCYFGRPIPGSAAKSRGGPGMTSKNLSFPNELEVE
jgi:hypothetical protein